MESLLNRSSNTSALAKAMVKGEFLRNLINRFVVWQIQIKGSG